MLTLEIVPRLVTNLIHDSSVVFVKIKAEKQRISCIKIISEVSDLLSRYRLQLLDFILSSSVAKLYDISKNDNRNCVDIKKLFFLKHCGTVIIIMPLKLTHARKAQSLAVKKLPEEMNERVGN